MPAIYDTDYYAWTQEQAAALRRVVELRLNLPDVDLEHLVEEIEDMGRSQWQALESTLSRVIEHLLKLQFSPATLPRAGGIESVEVHRIKAERLLRDNPSLRRRLALETLYPAARRLAGTSLSLRDGVPASSLPETCPYSLEQVLDDWFPPTPAVTP